MSNRARRLISFLASAKFFWIILGFFILESLWLVFSAVYPMAFDEDFHFGIIKIYSHHWLPFLLGQPPDANMYGAIARDPSYLYHYLMSFPYRFIELFTKDQTIQVIWLRLINVALAAYSLVLFRQLLLRAKISSAFTNVSMLLFALIPIVPLLAATVNYDNLVLVLIAWTGLLMAKIIPEIQAKRVPLRDLVVLAIVCLLGSIVKYPFLTVVVACVSTLLALSWHSFHRPQAILRAGRIAFRATSKTTKLVLLILFLVSLGLFSQRYALNLATYKTPTPDCDKVLTIDTCQSYGPFARNYAAAQQKSTAFHPHIWSFVPLWFYGMWYRLFFAINGNVPELWAQYQNFAPLAWPSVTGAAMAAASILVVIAMWRKIFYKDWLMSFFLLMSMLYLVALFFSDFKSYAYSGQPVAINGRYLLLVLLPLVAIAARGWQFILRKYKKLAGVLACVLILLFLQGGGVLAFILESNHGWYWPNHTVVTVNETAKRAAQKFVLFDQPLKINPPETPKVNLPHVKLKPSLHR